MNLAKRGADVNKLQDQLLQRLAKFVETYPASKEDFTPEAAHAAWHEISEFVNKEVDAKKWYEMLIKQVPRPSACRQALKGPLEAVDLEGKVLELAGPTTRVTAGRSTSANSAAK